MNKGISPLISTVIILAFVIAVAGILSTFLIDLTKEQKAGVEAKSAVLMDCVLADFEIDKDMISVGSTISVLVENKGQSALSGLKIVVYNSSGAFTLDASPSTMEIGDVKVLQASYSGVPILNKLKVSTTGCPGLEDSLDFTFIYQEYADETNVNINCKDGNWSTWYNIAWEPSWSYFNYKVPSGATNAIWEFKDEVGKTNFTLPSYVLDENMIYIRGHYDSDESLKYYYYNGSDWSLLDSRDTLLNEFYEEAIHWNVVDE